MSTETTEKPSTVRRVVTTEKILADKADDADESILSEQDKVDDAKIDAILSAEQLAGGTVRIERKGPTDQVYQYVTKMPVDQFDVEAIKRTFGGGDYKCKTFRSSGHMYRPFDFSIDYRFKGSIDVPSNGSPGPSRVEQKLVDHLIDRKPDNTVPMFMQMMTANQKASQDQMMMMVAMMQESSKQQATMMAGIFQAFATIGNRPQADTTATILPLLIEMVKMNGNGGKGSDLPALITAMKELKELTAGEQPAKEEEGVFDKIAKYGGPLLTALITKTPLQMPGVAALPPAPDNPEPEPDQPQPTVDPVEVKKKEVQALIAPYIQMMITAAKKDAPVESYCDMTFDLLDDNTLTELVKVLRLDSWFQVLSNDIPAAKPHQAWFTKLRDAIIHEYDESLKEAETSGNEATGLPSLPE